LADLHPLDQGDDREGGAMGIQADDGGLGHDEDKIDNTDVADILGDLLQGQEEELFHFVMLLSLQQQNNMDVEMEDGEACPGPSTLANSSYSWQHHMYGQKSSQKVEGVWEFCSRDDDNRDIEMLGQEDNPYSPFTSELELRIA
jgi:hypothetical protein